MAALRTTDGVEVGDTLRAVERVGSWFDVGDLVKVARNDDRYLYVIPLKNPDKGDGGFLPTRFEKVIPTVSTPELINTGDRVRAVKDYPEWFKTGDEFDVVRADEHGHIVVNVPVPWRTNGSSGVDGGFSSDHFEKVSPVTESTTSTPTPTGPLNLIDGDYGDLSVVGGIVVRGRVTKRIVAAPQGKNLLIEVAARNTTNVDTHTFLDTLTSTASTLGLSVKYVSDLKESFDAEARYKEFVKTGETSGVELTAEEIAALDLVKSLKAKFKEAFTLPELPKPAYPFQTLPAGVTDALVGYTLRTGTVYNGTYALTNSQVKQVWDFAKTFWKTNTTPTRNTTERLHGYREAITVRGAGSTYDVNVYPGKVTIGCQTIPRYVVEALAVKKGYEF
jgi:hypothetical protein